MMHRHDWLTSFIPLACCCLAAAACGGSSGGGTADSGSTAPNDAGQKPADSGQPMADAGQKGKPTFSAIYREIIVTTGCNGGSLCHGGAVGNLTMNSKEQAYTALVGMDAMGTNLKPDSGPNCKDSGLKRVVPGMPDQSLMMLKVEHMQPCGDPMPPTGVMLPAAQVEQIRTWIMNGANDD